MLPLDLHVLGLPLAFILSQDQTLHCKKNNFSSVPTDFFSFRFASRRRNQELTNCTTLQIIIKLFTVIQRTETRRFIFLFQSPVFAVRAKRDYKGMSNFSIDQNFFFTLPTLAPAGAPVFLDCGCKGMCFFVFRKIFCEIFLRFSWSTALLCCLSNKCGRKNFSGREGFLYSIREISRLWRTGRAGGRVCR